MIGALRPTSPHPPQIRAKDDYRQKEEDAGHLEPNDAANAPEGAKKTAHAAGNSSAGPSSNLSGSFDAIRCVRKGLRLRRGFIRGLARRGGFCRGGKPLASHLPHDAQSRAKDPANKLSSHTVYDGSSDVG